MVLQIRDEHEVAVLEMGISHFGEMHRLSKIARPDIYIRRIDVIFFGKTEIYKRLSVYFPDSLKHIVISVHKNRLLIDDCYNANPVSMEAAIDLLKMALTRKAAVLGDMFELGENSDALHERVGIVLLYRRSDKQYYLNDVPDDILSAAPSYAGKVGYICEYDT